MLAVRCVKCGFESEGTFCSRCGTRLSADSTPDSQPTLTTPVGVENPRRRSSSGSSAVLSTSTLDEGNFPPGSIIGQRYRVVSILGKGGMGEVYRANDLLVGQPVALKFLPESWAQEEAHIARLRNEVRVARMVTHPNVCRVYDLGEADGRLFVSMELIDGEDLAGLLRRIGHLPEAKGLEIAHQLCAGLAAAHEKGVIHRDLKPANIMVNGRGEAVITDFGLAGMKDEIKDVGSGTPAYMSPEQRAGTDVTARSDIYSLGIVLREIFTGKPAAIAAKSSDSKTDAMSAEVAIVIRRCLAEDVELRPTATQVARALPGGDPLAAAVAAGDTPSPELVAQCGEHSGLARAFALVLIAMALSGPLYTHVRERLLPNLTVMAPEELAAQARSLVQQTEGLTGRPPNEQFGFWFDENQMDRLNQRDVSPPLRHSALYYPREFWYRSSPLPLGNRRERLETDLGPTNPPMEQPGEVLVMFDSRGHLKRYQTVLDPLGKSQSPAQANWQPFLRMTGADPERIKKILEEPGRTLWEFEDAAGLTNTFSGISHNGRTESFQANGINEFPAPSIWGWLIRTALIGMAAFFAWRNARLGRWDVRGGLVLGGVILAASFLGSTLKGRDLTRWSSLIGPTDMLAMPLFIAAVYAVAFWAMEPFVRRRWPNMLVTWTRLLHGRWRDPTVGRDVLIGMVAGQLFRVLVLGFPIWVAVTGKPPAYSSFEFSENYNAYSGARHLLGALTLTFVSCLARAVLVTFVMSLCRWILKKDSLAMPGFIALFIPLSAGVFSNWNWMALVIFGIAGILVSYTLLRYGFLSVVALWMVIDIWGYPLTLDPNSWFSGYSFAVMALSSLLALIAYRISLGRQQPC